MEGFTLDPVVQTAALKGPGAAIIARKNNGSMNLDQGL
jgi:hypothetical protein